MSRIGKIPIVIPKGVNVSCAFPKVDVTGPRGSLSQVCPVGVGVVVEEGKVIVERPNDERTTRALQGLTRSLIANMVTGVTQGFEKKLEIIGVGFRADLDGKNLKLSVGYSHTVLFSIPEGIQVQVEKQTQITLKGNDKQQVGTLAAKLRAVKKPEPYKGKGIRYFGERIKKKVGKTKA
jgi:large subunit ribosomal protein L6